MIEKQSNYVRAAFLDNRVKELLKPENFYFFKIFGEKNEHDETNIKRNDIEK